MSDVVTIKKIIDEAYDTKTFVFDWDACVKPGQFIMIWIPGTDEIPMSVSGISEHTKSITVKAIGDATKKLHEYKEGDRLSIRGPFGNGFDLSNKNILIIGGGVGTAAVMPAVVQTGADTIIAARSDKDIILLETAKAHAKN
ncbi:MAG: dihydroorotate dehydrogenase electron transfer subunit, partial [Candidatus Methanomethylophilaceae archaeon]|nr:dihydroorotate dehydrogenase electron transfer subunit [Candidatus Methanomethylophilaceae archaeon]